MKKITLLMICLLAITFANAQLNSVALVGEGTPGGWPTGAEGEVDLNQMTLTGTDNWSISGIKLNGAVKFRGNNSYVPYDWGADGTSAFPTGKAVLGAGGALTVPSGIYNVTFNSTTLAYTFVKDETVFMVISIFGGATPGGWTYETDMTTTDGIHYTLQNIPLIEGELKFRGNHSWDLPYNWGINAYPSGKAIVDLNSTSFPFSGNYDITFNKETFDYAFTTSLSTKEFNASNFKVYPNPTQNSWNFSVLNSNIESIQIIDISGKVVLSVSPKTEMATIDASSLTRGMYFAKVATANATNTIKLLKD